MKKIKKKHFSVGFLKPQKIENCVSEEAWKQMRKKGAPEANKKWYHLSSGVSHSMRLLSLTIKPTRLNSKIRLNFKTASNAKIFYHVPFFLSLSLRNLVFSESIKNGNENCFFLYHRLKLLKRQKKIRWHSELRISIKIFGQVNWVVHNTVLVSWFLINSNWL